MLVWCHFGKTSNIVIYNTITGAKKKNLKKLNKSVYIVYFLCYNIYIITNKLLIKHRKKKKEFKKSE